MSFCKSTGRISVSDPRLKPRREPAQLLRDVPMEELEARDFQPESSMPFRLTANIADFIGQTGLHGLYAGVMTSCSIAISEHADKLSCFLVLALKDERLATPAGGGAPPAPEQVDEVAQLSADYTMYKMKSLCSHRRIIDLPRSSRELERERLLEEEPAEDHPGLWRQVGATRVPAHMLELQMPKPDMPEPFNKKVFRLIERALDDSRKRQMPPRWCPWF
jgi:phosphatidylinositol kinase/protein kinase (PI-3  family)